MQSLTINLKEFYEFMLNQLIEAEDYEKAAIIRDHIKTLDGTESIEYNEINKNLNNGKGINTKQ